MTRHQEVERERNTTDEPELWGSVDAVLSATKNTKKNEKPGFSQDDWSITSVQKLSQQAQNSLSRYCQVNTFSNPNIGTRDVCKARGRIKVSCTSSPHSETCDDHLFPLEVFCPGKNCLRSSASTMRTLGERFFFFCFCRLVALAPHVTSFVNFRVSR